MSTIRNRWTFGLGTIGRDMVYTLISMYMIFYLTDVIRLPNNTLWWVASIILMIRIFDAISDPVMGVIVDNTHTRWGKFKPWLVIGALLSAIFTVMLFTDFGLEGTAFVIVFAVCYLIWGLSYSANDIAYWSMLPTLSVDQKEREKIGSLARIFANMGLFFVVAAIVPLTEKLGHWSNSQQRGFFLFAVLVVMIMAAGQCVTLFGVKETGLVARRRQSTPLRELVQIIFKNDQLLFTAIALSLFMIGYTTTTSFGLYFFKYAYGDEGMYSIFALILGITQIASLALFPLFRKRFDRGTLFTAAIVLVVAGYILFFFAPTNTMLFISAAGILLFIGQSFVQLLMLMFVADTVDYGHWKLGKRNESVTFSLQPFIYKMGGAIASGVVSATVIVSGINDAETAADVTAEGLLLMKIAMLVFPLVCIVGSYIIYKKKYIIDSEFFTKMLNDLRDRGEIMETAEKAGGTMDAETTDATETEHMLSLKNKLRHIRAHPVGRDVTDRLLLHLNKPSWLMDNALVGNLRLKTIQRLLGKGISPGFFDAALVLFNSEPDVPDSKAVAPEPAWWKEAVFYQIYPRSFTDNGLRGILSKLDYLRELGIDAVWLSPVYDSPWDDNGYDVRDYYKILPAFGTMDDMDKLIAGLHERGMRLIMDLVVNHTSDEHPWFQSALNDKNSPYRDFYFFREGSDEPPNNWTSYFGGPAWNYYKEQDVWALCLFSKKQMDLNWECPALRKEIHKMARWWLEKGVDGFRLDVINYISKPPGLPDGDPFVGSVIGYTGVEHYFYGPRLHEYLKELRAEVFAPYGAFAVGETPGVGIQIGRLLTDAGRGELDLIFSFDHLETPGHTRFDDYGYDLTYLKRFYGERLNADRGHGWNTLFFNNHDNPRMISKIDPEGTYVEPLAKLLAVLQLTLRGTPFLYQGDEMGERNQPFTSIEQIQDVESLGLYAELMSTMAPEEAFRRVLAGTRDHARRPVRWDEIEGQRADGDSIWRFYQDLIALRRSSRVWVYGDLEFLHPKRKTLLCYKRSFTAQPAEGPPPSAVQGADQGCRVSALEAGHWLEEGFYVVANLTPEQVNFVPEQTAARSAKRRGLNHALTDEAKVLLCNYDGTPPVLRPYEVRVYRLP